MKKGLVLEGGGMRGLFSEGVIDEMLESGVRFDGMIGVSAGALFGCNFKSHQAGRALRYNIRFKDDSRYMSFWNLLKTGNLVDAEFSFHTLPNELDIFDKETFEKDKTEFHIVCTDVETGKPVYKQLTRIGDNELEWLRASGSLPIASKVVEVDGKKMLDGGISDSIPLKHFEDCGFEKNIVVLTQPKGFKKKQTGGMPIIKLILKKTPKIVEGLSKRHLMYNNELDYISEQEKKGKTLIICPDETLPIGRIEQDEKKMRLVYDMGRQAARKRMSEIKHFLELV